MSFKCHTLKIHYSVDNLVILDGKVLCLLYNDTTAMLKEYNIHQHYQTKHASQYFQFTGKQSEELENLNRSHRS